MEGGTGNSVLGGGKHRDWTVTAREEVTLLGYCIRVVDDVPRDRGELGVAAMVGV